MYMSNSICGTNPIYERSICVSECVSNIIAYIALIIIAVLAIPFVILIGLILGIWTLADKILAFIDRKKSTF